MTFLEICRILGICLLRDLMISATLNCYWIYRNDDIVMLIKKFVLKLSFEKKVFLTKFHFLHKAFHAMSQTMSVFVLWSMAKHVVFL